MALPSPLTDLFSRRLLIVSGKGGVGKTTVSIALARLGVRSGKRVLLAGIETQGELGRLLGRGTRCRAICLFPRPGMPRRL